MSSEEVTRWVICCHDILLSDCPPCLCLRIKELEHLLLQKETALADVRDAREQISAKLRFVLDKK